jgi:uncharacterized linocin/CFP29 family protein
MVLTGVLWLFPSVVVCGKAWIEVFNGATWPENWDELHANSPFWFSFVLSGRTLVNVAAPLAILVAVVSIGREMGNRMKLTMDEFLSVHDTEILAAVFVAISDLRPDLQLSEVEQDLVKDRARDAGAKLAEQVTIAPKDEDSRHG